MPKKPGGKGRFKENHVLTPVTDDTMMRLSNKLADEIGLTESVLLLQLDFWISISYREPINGLSWTFQSLSDLEEKLPWGRSTLERAVKSLISKKLIFVANFNKRKGDRTRWFALNLEEIRKLKSISVRENTAYSNQDGTSEFHNGKTAIQNGKPHGINGNASRHFGTASRQNGTTLPDNTSNITSETEANNSSYTSPLFESPSNDDDGGEENFSIGQDELKNWFFVNGHYYNDDRSQQSAIKQLCQLAAEGILDRNDIVDCCAWMLEEFDRVSPTPKSVFERIGTFLKGFDKDIRCYCSWSVYYER